MQGKSSRQFRARQETHTLLIDLALSLICGFLTTSVNHLVLKTLQCIWIELCWPTALFDWQAYYCIDVSRWWRYIDP